MKKVKRGNTYAISKNDAIFKLWSGVNRTPIRNVKLASVKDIGRKRIKKRHNFFKIFEIKKEISKNLSLMPFENYVFLRRTVFEVLLLNT